MKLRFYARPGHVLPWPGQMSSGQIRQYVGRESKVLDGVISHRANETPAEIDPETADGKRILRLFRIETEKPLVPANKETADALGVPFVPGKVVDGEWQADAATQKASAPSGKGNDK